MKRMTWCLLVLALVCTLPLAAEEAEDEERKRRKDFGPHGWGMRVGVGDDPDQVIGGVQFDFGEIKGLHLEPNIELMVGDDHLTLSGVYAVHYRFNHIEQFRPYAGLGLGLAVDYFDPDNGSDDTDLDLGLRGIGGFNWALKNGREVFLEGSFGMGYVNDLQLMFGWSF